MKIYITVTTQFEGFHRWLGAPECVGFLRSLHRHVFHVKAVKRVSHSERDLEFILLKRAVDAGVLFLQQSAGSDEWSCERWACALAEKFGLAECEVSEDGENGARVVTE